MWFSIFYCTTVDFTFTVFFWNFNSFSLLKRLTSVCYSRVFDVTLIKLSNNLDLARFEGSPAELNDIPIMHS